MQITVSGIHTEIPASLREYVEEKASKFERYYDRVQTVEVVFAAEASKLKCEIIARADHHATFVAKEIHEDAFAAFDTTARELERQLTRHKEKHRNHKHPEADRMG